MIPGQFGEQQKDRSNLERMKRYIHKILAVGLGVAALTLCIPAEPVLAASAQTTVVEEVADLMKAATLSLKAPRPKVEQIGYDSVTLSWSEAKAAVSYELQQSVDKKKYKKVAKVKQGAELRYTVTGLDTAKTYYYRIVARDAAGKKAISAVRAVKTVLSAPVFTTLQPGACDKMDLAWTEVEGADYYRVYRSTEPESGYKRVKTVYETSYSNQVTMDVTYYYKIAAVRVNPSGKKVKGAYSEVLSGMATMGKSEITGISNNVYGVVTMNWNLIPGADGYEVSRSTKPAGSYETIGLAGAEAVSWQDVTAEAGTMYYYRVRAYKVVKEQVVYGEYSDEKAIVTVLPAPAELSVMQTGDTAVSVNWSPVDAAEYYRLYRAEGTSGKYKLIGSKVALCTFSDTGLIKGKTYTYRVETVSGALVSGKTESIPITIETLKLNTRTLYLGPGVKGTLSVTNDVSGTIVWSSEDPDVAVVGQDGVVVGVKPGKTQVLVTVDTIQVSVSVTVTDGLYNGIDVSKWQELIDWKTVKASGVNFVMMRLAYGTSKDVKFESHYAGATEQGISVGVYCYSTAKTVKEGIKEAKNLIKLLDGRELGYPVALDLEDKAQKDNMDNDQRTELILEYKRIVEEAGYQFVVYANLDWLKNYIDQSVLESEGVDIWIARYRNHTLGYGYTGGGNVRMWQYSSTGQVDGILKDNGLFANVDLDVCYDGY